MSRYFEETDHIISQIMDSSRNGKTLTSEENGIISTSTKGAFHNSVIQGVLAMSEEELVELKSKYCETLSKHVNQYQDYAPVIQTLIGVYSSLSPEEFRASMLDPRVLGSSGFTDLRKFAINSSSYIRNGQFDDNAIGMNYGYSKDDIENPYLTESMQGLTKREAEERANDIKEKLEAGMSLSDAVRSDLGYRETQGMGK